MKWIGQHIWSFISRFRNDIYMEDVSSGTIASGSNLGLDSNNKVVKATVSGTDTTYGVSCVDGDNSDEEKIRLTGSDSSTDDVVLEAGTGLSIARSGDKITFTNTVTDTDTILTTEQVQDIAGALVATGGTKTLISVTYDDANNNMDFVVDNDLSNYDNSSSGFITSTLTTEQVQDIVGAMFSSNTETNITVTYQDADGTIDLASTDTNTQNSYAISCVDGDNSDEEKIRLTQSGADGAATDDIVLEAGTGLSIARSGDKITFTNTVSDTNTQLSTEQVQDIVGAMFSGNTETNITVTYQDGDGTIDLVSTDTNTNQLTEFTLTGDSGSNQTIAHGNTLDVAGGTGMSTVVGSTDTVTVNANTFGANTSASASADATDTPHNWYAVMTDSNDKLVVRVPVPSVDYASHTPANNDFVKFTDANTIVGRSFAETKSDLSLDNVENKSAATIIAEANALTKQCTYNYFKSAVSETMIHVGLQEADAEATGVTNKNLPILTGVAGKLLKVFVRAGEDLRNVNITITLKNLTTSYAVNSNNTTIRGAQTVAGLASGALHTFDFTSGLDSGVGSETNVVSAGDMLLLGFTAAGDEAFEGTGNINWYVTCLWEFDYS